MLPMLIPKCRRNNAGSLTEAKMASSAGYVLTEQLAGPATVQSAMFHHNTSPQPHCRGVSMHGLGLLEVTIGVKGLGN